MAKNNNKHVVRQKLCLRKYNSAVNINLKNIVSGSIPTQNKGITLVTLSITIIILLIITTAGISTSLDRFEVNNYRKMKSDLELLEDKVSDYYLKYEGLPVLRTSDSNIEVFNYKEYIKGLTNTNQEPVTNANDNDTYYIIDLEALGNITLNYGRDFEKYKNNTVNAKEDVDVYIINEQSHTIYYVQGVEMDGVTYHYIKKDEQITDDIPPIAPEIRIVSGVKVQGNYINRVKVNVIPGKKKVTEIKSTYYTIVKDESQIRSGKVSDEGQIFYLKDTGEYTISAYNEGINGQKSKITNYKISINIINYRDNNGEDAQNRILSYTENVKVWDYLDNKLVVPAGFRIIEESIASKDTIIEDERGNQFVWISIGNKTIHNNIEDEKIYLRKLCRAKFGKYSTGVFWSIRKLEPDDKIYLTDYIIYSYIEAKKDVNTNNSHAKDIEKFITDTYATGGYYIGRYEARTKTERKSANDELTSVTLNKDDYVYNYVTQAQASKLCQEMYSSDAFTSDLANSFAWDTALIDYAAVYYGTGGANEYALCDGRASNSQLKITGMSTLESTGSVDKEYNIYDMAGNCKEWTTETYSNSSMPATLRGGKYNGKEDNYTSSRESSSGRCRGIYII